MSTAPSSAAVFRATDRQPRAHPRQRLSSIRHPQGAPGDVIHRHEFPDLALVPRPEPSSETSRLRHSRRHRKVTPRMPNRRRCLSVTMDRTGVDSLPDGVSSMRRRAALGSFFLKATATSRNGSLSKLRARTSAYRAGGRDCGTRRSTACRPLARDSSRVRRVRSRRVAVELSLGA